jgi:hypothetical protein
VVDGGASYLASDEVAGSRRPGVAPGSRDPIALRVPPRGEDHGEGHEDPQLLNPDEAGLASKVDASSSASSAPGRERDRAASAGGT